jgi:tetratricopeptide (TPR) repeat protein
LKLNNRSAAAYAAVGACLVAKGDTKRALTYYQYSLMLDPNNAPIKAYVARLQTAAGGSASGSGLAAANTLYRQGDYAHAATAYEGVIQSQPDNARAYQGLGNAYFGLGRKSDAMAQYHKSLELNPTNKALADFLAANEAQASKPSQGGDWLQLAWRSAILPGWGQFYNGQPTKGLVLGGVTLGLWAGEIGTYFAGESAMHKYESLTSNNPADYNGPYNTWNQMADINHVCYIGMTAFYLYTLIDAIVCSHGSGSSTALLPQGDPAFQVTAEAQGIGFKAKVLTF